MVIVGLFAVRMMQGRINVTGLMSATPGGRADPERALLLTATLAVAFYYTLKTITTPLSALPEQNGVYAMPDISVDLLTLLGGTQATYLSAKTWRFLLLMGDRDA